MDELKPAPGECPVCAGAIDERERIICPRCETPHHRDCYSYNLGCAIFGCNPQAPATPMPKKGHPPFPWVSVPPALRLPLQIVAVLAFFTLVGAVSDRAKLATGKRTIGWITATKTIRPAPRTGVQAGELAPDFTLKDIDGYEHSFSSHSRGHVSVLTFWLARCPDCLTSFPKGVSLSKKFKGSGVYFTDVAYTGQPEATAQWVKETGIVNPVLLDCSGSTVRTYSVATYTCFVLDPKGVILYRGPVDGVEETVRRALGEQDARVR